MRWLRFARVSLVPGPVLALAVLVVPFGGLAHADSTPYTDQNVVGSITFCDKSGHQVTTGSINDRPFAYRVIGSAAAPKPYDGPGRTATLFGYQPRAQTAPGNWSGEQLTASSRYTDPAHPMVAATARDSSVGDLISDYPPQVDGLVQLRIFLGEPNQPTYNLKYNAVDLRVSGSTWTAVDAGTASCSASGTSTSIEDLLPQPSNPASTTTPSPAASSASAAPRATRSAPSPAASATGSTVAAPAGAPAAAETGGGTGQAVVIVVLVVAALAGGAWYLVSRQRGSPAP